MEVVVAAGLDHGDIRIHDFVLRAGVTLDLRAAGAVIEVAVADEKNFGVAEFEAE